VNVDDPRMITAFVPARQGSQRLPNKNMRQLAGVSLASLSVVQALQLDEVQEVVFSTDSEEYAETVFRDVEASRISTDRLKIHYRDSAAAGPQAKIFDVLRSMSDQSYFDSEFVALMLPTAPLRRRSTAAKVIDLAKNHGRTSFTACAYDFHVTFAFTLAVDQRGDQPWQPLLGESPMVTGTTRSQDQVQYLHPHGGLALVKVSRLTQQRTIYERAIPVTTTRTEGLDVDVSEDLDLVRCLEEGLLDTFPFLPE